MNKHCYRVIFSRAKGQLVVVAENVASQRKTHSQATGVSAKPAPIVSSLKPLHFSLWLAMGWVLSGQPVLADIVADRNALGNQQATVLNAGNGVPLVNIQTPSAGGVSRNVYSQFDVQQQGAILNNSRTDVQTQLGGYVQGNPWLATGSAKVILNEVNSSNPSQLQGYVEVAGSRAEVVIANPSGISCNGCGFINANRATLTTGQTQVNGGIIQGYRVERGEISVNGLGLDSSQSDYTDLIARSVKVNAAIHANQLKVSTGAHQTDAAHDTITATQPTSQTPTVAIDVAQLGGMYANKITLIGTEAGVGVRNAGHIGASAGDVVISNNGTLENIGQINASQNLNLSIQGDLNNSGTAYAQANTQINTAATLNNSGTIAAQQNTIISANNIQTSGALAAGVNQQGTAVGSANLQVNANETLIASGQNLATEQQTLTAKQIDLSHSETSAKNLTITASQAAINLDNAKVVASQNLTATTQTTLSNRQGQVAANQLTLTAHDLDNSGGELIQTGNQNLSLKLAGQINNQQGTIASNSDNLSLIAQQINNTDGKLQHAGSGQFSIQTDRLDNRGGQVQAQSDLNLALTDALDNRASLIRAGQTLTISADSVDNRNTQGKDQGLEAKNLNLSARQIQNQQGAMRANQQLTINSTEQLNNSSGLISSLQNLTLQDPVATANNNPAKTLNIINTSGTLIAGNQLNIDSASLSGDGSVLSETDLSLKLTKDYNHNSNAHLQANHNLQLDTLGALHNQGVIQAASHLNLTAANIDNRYQSQLLAEQVNLKTAGILDNRGLINGTQTYIDALILNNLGSGQIYGDQLAIQANTLNNVEETVNGNTKAAVIAARERLDIGAQAITNREHSMLFSLGDMAMGGQLDNQYRAINQAGVLNNKSATIEAMNDLVVSANEINNTNEHLETQQVQVSTEAKHEYQGQQFFYGHYADPNPQRYQANQVSFVPDTLSQGLTLLLRPNTAIGISQDYMNYYEYQFTRSVTETQVSKTDPGRILAGGAMAITGGALFNLDSQIIAGGNLDSQLTTLNNQASMGERITTDIGRQYYWQSFEPGGANNDYTTMTAAYNYAPSPVVKNIALDTVRIEGNTAPVGSHTQIASLSLNNVNQNANGANAVGVDLQTGSNASTQIHKQSFPNNSLFNVNPSPVSRYLVETSGQFTNYKQWLSSDYLLSKLAIDPNVTQKRMGDGFYEQKLVREQIAQLTGQRFLNGYSNDETEYRALMDNGLTFAQSHQLIPGVALSAAQMAQLTSDIVWLVAEDVTLADGSVQSVLVPHVYAKLNATDIDGNGTLLAGNSLNLNLTGDLNNSGTLAGRQVTRINAETINNLGGSITGNQVAVTAKTDLNNIGGQISANNQLAIEAGRDIKLASITRSSSNDQGSNTVLDRIAGLYVKGANGILSAKAGNDINLMAAQINNSGSNGQSQLLAGRDLLLGTVGTSSQNRVANNNGFWSESSRQENTTSILSDGNLNLFAKRDLTLQGASINNTQGDLLLNAGRELQLDVAQNSRQYAQSQSGNGISVSSRVDAVNNQSTQLNSAGNIGLQSGDNLNLISAQLKAGQDLTLIAGHNLNLSAVKDTQDYASSSRIKPRTDVLQRQDQQVVSNNLNVNGNIRLAAQGTDGNIKILASNITSSDGRLSLAATQDINLDTVNEQHQSVEQRSQKRSSLLSSSQKNTTTESQSSLAVGNNLSANTVEVLAGHNLAVTGSSVVADQAVNLLAGNDIKLLTANNHSEQTTLVNSKKSGFLGGTGGAGFTIGSQTSKTTTHTVEDQAVASTIGSLQGDVTIQAGRHYQQTGSDVLATQGNVDILAQQVDITATKNLSQTTIDQKSQQTGLSISLSNPVVHAVETGINMAQAAKNTSNTRMQALAAANTGLVAYNAYNAVNEVANTPDGSSVGGYGVNFSLGHSENQSHSEQQQNNAQGSQVVAGQNLSIFATGNDTADSGNLNVIGSNLSAGKNLTLSAVNDLRLQAAENQSSQQSRNSSLSASIGMTIGVGQQTGVSFNAGVSGSKGKANGEDIRYSNTHVSAGNQVSLNSGQDTALKGAVVSGQQIVANIGTSGQGNLNIESLQDQSRYSSEQKSGGVSVSVCLPPICGGAPVGGTVNYSKSNINSNYLSVTEQSGLKAGDGGFQIQVNGNTDLIGGLIASNNSAVDLGLNHLITETLTRRDLQNQAKYKANSLGISAGIGLNMGATGMLQSSPSGMAGYGSDSGKANSITFSAVSAGHLQVTNAAAQQAKTGQNAAQTVAGLNRDTANAENAIKPIFDQQKVENEINGQVQITQVFGQQASNVVAQYANSKLDEATEKLKQANDHKNSLTDSQREQLMSEANQLNQTWQEGGVGRVALHTAVGGLTGNIQGAMGAGVSAATIPIIGNAIMDLDIPLPSKQLMVITAASAIGYAAGDFTGASAALSEAVNNFLFSMNKKELAKQAAACSSNNSDACARQVVLENRDKILDELRMTYSDKTSIEDMKVMINEAAKLYQSDFAKYGIDAASYLLTMAAIESGFNPTANNKSFLGLYQLNHNHEDTYSIGLESSEKTIRLDPVWSLSAAAEYSLRLAGILNNKNILITPAKLYALYQQGEGGGVALLTHSNLLATDALMTLKFYDKYDKAKNAIIGNGGNLSMTGAQFIAHWENKYNKKHSEILR